MTLSPAICLGKVDLSGLFQADGNNVDLSKMVDLSGISIDLPDAGNLDLGDLMSGLKLTVSAEGMNEVCRGSAFGIPRLCERASGPDYSGLQSDFTGYLRTTPPRILKSSIRDIIEANGGLTASKQQIQGTLQGNPGRVYEVRHGAWLYRC